MHTRRYMALGFVATLVVTLTSGVRGWPFPNLTAEPWLFQISVDGKVGRYGFLALFYAAVVLLGWCWYQLVQASRADNFSSKKVALTFAIWVAPLIFATPLFSGDVYVYWADGQLINRGFDPYTYGVSALGSVPIVQTIHPLWRDTTTMYGPLFVRIAQLVAAITPNSVIAGAIVFRFVAIAFVAMMGFGIKSILKHIGRPVAQGLAFTLLNPLTILHLVGGEHNDAMMLGFLFVAIAVGLKYQSAPMRLLALALCAAAGAFKIPGFAGALMLGWIWAGTDVSVKRRLAGCAVAGVFALAAFEIETVMTGLNWGWLNASNVPGLAHPLLAPPNALAFSLGAPFGGGFGINSLTRAAAEGCALLLSAYLLIRTGRRSTPEDAMRAFAWGLLVIAWTGPAVYPWYLAWGVALAGTVGLHSMRKPLMIAIVGVNVFVAPGGYGMLDEFTDWRRTVVAFITVAAYAAIAVYLYKRAHRGGYLSLSGPNWNAKSEAVSDMPSLISPLVMNVRS